MKNSNWWETMTNKNTFYNFVSQVHPDVDTLMIKKVNDAWNEICSLAEHYHTCIGKTHCKICGNEFGETDFKLEKSKPKGVCIACFTGNA